MSEPDMELWDLRITVDSIEGRSVCGVELLGREVLPLLRR